MQRDQSPRKPGLLGGAHTPAAPKTPCHPGREDWMTWLYEEMPPERAQAMETHLAACPECANHISAWRHAMQDLGAWQLPATGRPAARPRRRWLAPMRWAAAAAILLTAGYLAGRLNGSRSPALIHATVDATVAERVQAARAELAGDLQQTLIKQLSSISDSNRADVARLFGELATSLNQSRLADQQNVLAALKELDARWLGVYASFRRELETVAILTETGLKDTQRQLVQMANLNESQQVEGD